MGIKCCFQVPEQSKSTSFALLLLRLVAGVAFMYHGWGKIQNPFAWMPETSGIPGIFQFLAALAEFGGGIAWILGALTSIASFGLACTMAVAVYFHAVVMGDPFVSKVGGGSYELGLLFLTISVLFMLMGPGKFSVDAKLFGKRTCQ